MRMCYEPKNSTSDLQMQSVTFNRDSTVKESLPKYWIHVLALVYLQILYDIDARKQLSQTKFRKRFHQKGILLVAEFASLHGLKQR